MTTVAGSALTHIFEETKQAQNSFSGIEQLLINKVNAEETSNIEDKQQQDTNHTFTTSLNTYTPSAVIGNILPTPSQSPEQEENESKGVYKNILAGLVPIWGEDIDYETILGLSEADIKSIIECDNVGIWQIAKEQNEITLLENTYYTIYPTRIIKLLTDGAITQEMADALIERANNDIAAHKNTAIEAMIENMLTTD